MHKMDCESSPGLSPEHCSHLGLAGAQRVCQVCRFLVQPPYLPVGSWAIPILQERLLGLRYPRAA